MLVGAVESVGLLFACFVEYSGGEHQNSPVKYKLGLNMSLLLVWPLHR